MVNLFDRCGEQIFVDEKNNRIIKSIISRNADILYIAELPLNRPVREEEYIQVAFSKEDAKRHNAEIDELLHSADIKLPFKLKDKNNEILLNTQEQLNNVLWSLTRFLKSGEIMSQISIQYWESGKPKIEEFDISEKSEENVKDILSEFGQPTKIETKSVEEDIVVWVLSTVGGKILWYIAKESLDEIRGKIKKYLSYKKKLDYIQ